MLNHITIMGRLTRDVELRRTGGGVAVSSFTVAVDRDNRNSDGERDTDFIDVVAWRQLGEFIARNFRKGSMIVVTGRLQIRNWTDNSGTKHRAAEVVADNSYFGEPKRDPYGAPNQGYREQNGVGYNQFSSGQNFALLEDDDAELPY